MTDQDKGTPEEPKAFLHIVHVSDMHCHDGGGSADRDMDDTVQVWVARLRKLGRKRLADFVQHLWEEGLQGHDPDAHDRFFDFATWFAKQDRFKGVETWLLDTGDLTTMGDAGSVDTAMEWLEKFKTQFNASQLFVLYGNHDSWPGRFPYGTPHAELVRHRQTMRGGKFAASWPQGPLSADIPCTESKILLYGVNSAIDDIWNNSRALGEVGLDPNWATGGAGTDQMVQLAFNARKGFHEDGKTRDFRILAVHHPVHYPERPPHWMSMTNDDAVANALIRFGKEERGKLAHLVLSGHTHVAFPPLGQLPGTAVGREFKPLTRGQLQLIAGSLTQMPRDEEREKLPPDHLFQQCQILTFRADPRSAKRKLQVERRIVGRAGEEYRIITPNNSSKDGESFSIEY